MPQVGPTLTIAGSLSFGGGPGRVGGFTNRPFRNDPFPNVGVVADIHLLAPATFVLATEDEGGSGGNGAGAPERPA